MIDFRAVVMGAGDHLDLIMYGQVGRSWFDDDGITDSMVQQALKQAPNAKTIRVRMNSGGGDAFQGIAIKNLLASHPAHVTCDIEGLSASAASIIAMGCDTVRMCEGTSMMVHEAQTMTRGDVVEHERSIGCLNTINDGAAQAYARKSKRPVDEMRALMAAETWLTPEKAKGLGLADEVTSPADIPSASASMSADLGRWGYRNVPPQLMAAHPAPRREEPDMKDLKKIALALGLPETADEAAVMSAIAERDPHVAVLAELSTVTGKTDLKEAVAVVAAWKQGAEQAVALEAQMAERDQKAEREEHARLVAQGKRDKKIVAKNETYCSSKTSAELRVFLENAPAVVAAALQQPGAHETGNAESDPEPKHGGKTWAEMSAAAKHNLFVEHREVYDAMKADHKRRKG